MVSLRAEYWIPTTQERTINKQQRAKNRQIVGKSVKPKLRNSNLLWRTFIEPLQGT